MMTKGFRVAGVGHGLARVVVVGGNEQMRRGSC
jgi:hypothetical protein